MNCDSTKGCPKWNDLISTYGWSICQYGGCAGGSNYVSETNSFMKKLNYNVGPVLKRYTCCSYLALTQSIPSYCNEFLNKGLGLYTYCTKSGYIADGSTAVNESGESFEERSITLPTGRYFYVENPIRMVLKVKDIDALSPNNSYITPIYKYAEAGFFVSTSLEGENIDNNASTLKNTVKVSITYNGTHDSPTVLYFNLLESIAVPPSTTAGVDTALVKRKRIEIILNRDKFESISKVEVQKGIL